VTAHHLPETKRAFQRLNRRQRQKGFGKRRRRIISLPTLLPARSPSRRVGTFFFHPLVLVAFQPQKISGGSKAARKGFAVSRVDAGSLAYTSEPNFSRKWRRTASLGFTRLRSPPSPCPTSSASAFSVLRSVFMELTYAQKSPHIVQTPFS